jgi:hypothetical protein
LYELIQFLPPFWLTSIGLTLLYIAPLVASPRGRAAARDASVRAQELANTAADKGKEVAQDGQAKAAELSSKAQQSAQDAQGRIQQTAQDAQWRLQDTIQSGKQTAQDAHGRIESMARSGKQTATDRSVRARDTTSNISGSAAENVDNLTQTGANVINSIPGNASSALGNAKQYISSTLPDTVKDGAAHQATQLSNGADNSAKQVVPEGVADQVNSLGNKSRLISGSTTETAGQTGPGGNGSERIKQATSNHGRDGISSSPGQTGSDYTVASNAAATHSMMDRPRGSFEAQESSRGL